MQSWTRRNRARRGRGLRRHIRFMFTPYSPRKGESNVSFYQIKRNASKTCLHFYQETYPFYVMRIAKVRLCFQVLFSPVFALDKHGRLQSVNRFVKRAPKRSHLRWCFLLKKKLLSKSRRRQNEGWARQRGGRGVVARTPAIIMFLPLRKKAVIIQLNIPPTITK